MSPKKRGKGKGRTKMVQMEFRIAGAPELGRRLNEETLRSTGMIGGYAFLNGSRVGVEIPRSVTSAGQQVRYSCPYCNGTSPPTLIDAHKKVGGISLGGRQVELVQRGGRWTHKCPNCRTFFDIPEGNEILP